MAGPVVLNLDRHSILTRLWSYLCLLPSEIAVAYTLQGRIPADREGLWLEFLEDLAGRRLHHSEIQERYLPLFDDRAAAPAAMLALQRAWSAPRMAVLREQMEKDIERLRLSETALVPARAPLHRGNESAPADEDTG